MVIAALVVARVITTTITTLPMPNIIPGMW